MYTAIRRELLAALPPTYPDDPVVLKLLIRLDPGALEHQRLVAYLLGWSFVGPDGAPVPLTDDAIGQLEWSTYQEMLTALDAHDKRVREAHDAEKKMPSGETPSSSTSASVN